MTIWNPTVDELDALPPGTTIRLDARNDEEPWKRPEPTKVTRALWELLGTELTSAELIELRRWQGVEVITEGSWIGTPGWHADMDERLYHSDPVEAGSLSASRAKTLIAPGGPAKYRHTQIHGRPEKAEFDLGHAAHALVLGVGAPIRHIQYDDLRTKAAKAAVDQARADGEIPLKSREFYQVHAMADALKAVPAAVEALKGEHEVSAFAKHASGVWLRGRFDSVGDGFLADFKTAVTADPNVFARKAVDFGYDLQAAWYVDLAEEVGLVEQGRFRFVVQEKTAPYLVSVIELDDDFITYGRERARDAIDIYQRCRESGEWPGYPAETVTVSLPRWLTPTTTAALDPNIEAAFAELIGGVA